MAVKPIETRYVDRPEISETFADHGWWAQWNKRGWSSATSRLSRQS